MPTIPETLTNLADAARAALAKWQDLYDAIVAKQAETVTKVTNTINVFNTRPLAVFYFVDAVNGSDANDGSTPALAKRTADSILANIGSQGVNIVFLSDDTIRLRHNCATNVSFNGGQRANNGQGYINFPRSISLLGAAENSPSPTVGTMTSGIFFSAGQLFTTNITFFLPDVPANTNQRPHFASAAFVNMQFSSGAVAATANAAALIGSFNGGRSTVTFESFALASGATGHVFDGVAAGADPNALWKYSTNLKSA